MSDEFVGACDVGTRVGAAAGEADRTAIRVRDLVKSFRFGGQTVEALRGVSFEIRRGTVVGIVGSSGSGKTTLVNILGGLDSPTAGEVWVEGLSIHGLAEAQLTSYRRRWVGFVFQAYNLIPNISAVENVSLPLEFAGVPRRRREERARYCLEQAGLPQERHRHTPARLSGGEQQRVAVARSLVNDPAFILADEPTGNLDSTNSDQVMALLTSLSREHGKTVLVVTHDHVLASQADTVLSMRDGKVFSG